MQPGLLCGPLGCRLVGGRSVDYVDVLIEAVGEIVWLPGSPEERRDARQRIIRRRRMGISYLVSLTATPDLQRWHFPTPRPDTATELEDCSPDIGDQRSAEVFRRLISLSRTEAWRIVGGLSRPSKMPCYSWGIPAQTCQIGSKLMQITGSVCQSCYALKGYFRTHRVQRAYQRRMDLYGGPQWIEAMVKLIYWQAAETGEPFFRWFDSGDLQSVEMLRDIVAVAELTPEIQHWLPTREYATVQEYLRRATLPINLTVRLSALLVDGAAPRHLGLPTSTVHTSTAPGFSCSARDEEPVNCRECRACWDGEVENVSYPLH